MVDHLKKLDDIIKVIQAAKSRKDLQNLLIDILSPAEIEDISDRIHIFKELLKNNSQREVSAKLKVSIAKVTRAAHVIKYGSGVLSKVL